MNKSDVDKLLRKYPLRSDMINEKHVRRVLDCLDWTIKHGIHGDIVELGCNAGNMAVYLQAVALQAGKQYHAYDSFEGLPAIAPQDETPARTAKPGDLAVSLEQFVEKFNEYNLQLPIIHQGWFKEQSYPRCISFAFLDGDFFDSIMDSWKAIYPRLTPGAVVCVHDYGFEPLPGVKSACDYFMNQLDESMPEPVMYWDDYVAIYHF